MKRKTWLRVSTSLVLCAGLLGATACAANGSGNMGENPVLTPITMSHAELENSTVKLIVGQALNISTDSLEVEDFDAEISDPTVVEFKAGVSDGSAIFNPGIIALEKGSSSVKLVNELDSSQTFEFTVNVVAQ